MARITVEDCLQVVDNRFELVMMASKRARQLAGGVESKLDNSESQDKPTVLALRDQVAPPTINLDNPDDECDLDLVPHVAKAGNFEYALSNSFGFGGTNGSLIFKRV